MHDGGMKPDLDELISYLPPWTREELLTLCTNAQNYLQTRQGSGGVAAAAADWASAVPLWQQLRAHLALER